MNANELLNRVLNDPALAEEKQRLLARLTEGRRQLDNGEYVELDDEGLERLFDELKKRAQRQPHEPL